MAMSRGPMAWLHGVGLTTPVGLTAAATAASVRAGIVRRRQSPIYGRGNNPLHLAWLLDDVLPPLHPELAAQGALTSRQRRMLRLATYAIQEAVAPLRDTQGIPLVLAVPETLPAQQSIIGPSFLEQLARQTEVNFAHQRSTLLNGGRASGLQALELAIRLLHERNHTYVLVGGVDSLIDLELLGLLDQENRVQTEGIADGFVPGEGAAFLLLGIRQTLPGSNALASIAAPGVGQEKGHRYSHEPYLGDGLTNAIRSAVEHAGVPSIRTVMSSLNGESFGGKEWGTAAIRNSDAFHRPLRLETPAECFGDLGAAIGPVLVALAALGMAKGYLPAPSMVWCSSEMALRAAAVVVPLVKSR